MVVVSSGDPGVFAMASAVFEAVEGGPPEWRSLDIRVLPGVTAMLAAAARAGAPLGHDFCAINLSDNLKPWPVIERRLRLAAQADFAMALYNPRSASRPHGFTRALEVLRETCGDARPVIFARAVATPEEVLRVVALGEAKPEMADMRTLVIVGSSTTRVIARDGLALGLHAAVRPGPACPHDPATATPRRRWTLRAGARAPAVPPSRPAGPGRAPRASLASAPPPPAFLATTMSTRCSAHEREVALHIEGAARHDHRVLRAGAAARPAGRPAAGCSDAAAGPRTPRNASGPTASMTRCAGPARAATAPAMSGTDCQRSPGPACQPGRVSASRGIPACRAAASACRLICAANGCVASTRWVTACSCR